jgi:hypothetical protein
MGDVDARRLAALDDAAGGGAPAISPRTDAAQRATLLGGRIDQHAVTMGAPHSG